jgi:predicted ester cyclase
MTIQERNKELVRRLLAEVDRHGSSAVDKFCAPDCKMHFPSNAPPISRDDHKMLVQSVMEAFPNLKHKILDSIAEGDYVATRETLTGTHDGDFMGAAPTGRPVEFSAICIWRWENDKLVEYWSDTDMAGLYEQLGMVLRLSAEEPLATI